MHRHTIRRRHTPQCEDCTIDDDGRQCPFEGGDEYCPFISMIEKCAGCGKSIHKVKGLIKPEETATYYDISYCCSKECATKLQAEYNKEIEERKKHHDD
jgi:hypothetical protein